MIECNTKDDHSNLRKTVNDEDGWLSGTRLCRVSCISERGITVDESGGCFRETIDDF